MKAIIPVHSGYDSHAGSQKHFHAAVVFEYGRGCNRSLRLCLEILENTHGQS